MYQTLLRTIVLSITLLCPMASAQEGTRVIAKRSHALHQPNTSGNLRKINWLGLAVSDDSTQIAGTGYQGKNEGILASSVRSKDTLIAVWTLKTGKSVRSAPVLNTVEQVTFAPDGKSLIGWALEHEFLPTEGRCPITYWDFSKPHTQTIITDLGRPQGVLFCQIAGATKAMKLIAVAPSVTQSLPYKFEPPKIIPKPKVETVLNPTGTTNLARPDSRSSIEPVAVSRDGTWMAQSTGRNVCVVNVATGEVVATCSERLGNTEIRVPLAISKDGSKVALGVQAATENDPSHIVIFEGQSGRVIATCRGHRSYIARLAMTPDGARLASTSPDKTVRVWDVATAKELATITGVGEGTTAVAISPDGNSVVTASVNGEVEVWSLNAGDVDSTKPMPVANLTPLKEDSRPPLKLPRAEFKSAPQTKPQEELYLSVSARRMVDSLSSIAEQPAGSLAHQQFLDEAKSKATRARAIGANAATIGALDGIPQLLTTLTEEAGKRREVLRTHKKELRELAAAAKDNELNLQGGWFFGLMGFVIGELPTFSNQYDPVTRTMQTVETGTLSPALSNYGMSLAINSLFDGIAAKGQLAEMESVSHEVTRRLISKSLQRQADILNGARRPIDGVLTQQLGGQALREIPEPQAVSNSKSMKAFEAVLDAAQARATQLKNGLGRDEPFAAASAIILRSFVSVPGSQRVTDWPKLAAELQQLAHQVPAGNEYDRDRASLLGMAAELSLKAVALKRGTVSWTKQEMQEAITPLGWLEDALRFDAKDITGELREQKAWALCEAGRIRDGYVLGQEIKPLRGSWPRYRFMLARAAHCLGRSEESLDELGVSIERLGLSDLKAVRECSDLPRTAAKFKELTTIKFDIVSESVLRGGKARIVNESSFPITNAKFELTFPVARGTAKSQLEVMYLAPGEECRIAYNDDYIPRQGIGFKGPENKGSVKLITSDQGTTSGLLVK